MSRDKTPDFENTYNPVRYKKTVDDMKKKISEGGSINTSGLKTYDETGELDQSVNVFRNKRVSHNALSNDNILVNGIKLPAVSFTDGTHSMGKYLLQGFFSLGRVFEKVSPFLKGKYQFDYAVGMVQDKDDVHPVVQMSQFESADILTKYIQKIVYDDNGLDPPEDYPLALAYVNDQVEIDISQYGLKGYFFMIGDAEGRGNVFASSVEKHLGYKIQSYSVSTKSICNDLLKKWHFFFIQVQGNYSCTEFWEGLVGSSRIIKVDNGDLLAEVQAGLIYVTETKNPTEEGFIDFLMGAEGNHNISKQDAKTVWVYLQSARALFGAQANLSGYNDIPKPGSQFKHYRDLWPIGHSRESENPSYGNTPIQSPPLTTNVSDGLGIDWDVKF